MTARQTTRTSHGWDNPPPCPPWCATASQHYGDRLRMRTDDYWHTGQPVRVLTEETTPNWDPIFAEVGLCQQMHAVDGRYHHHPVLVTLNRDTLTPASARRLADALMALADQAEAMTV